MKFNNFATGMLQA